MLSNVISAGKDIANKLTNKFLNLSEIEIKIKTATNDENWGPSGSIMKEISDETFSTSNFQDVMTFLWYRIFTEKPLNNRRTYKGLVLLSYLIINGSDLVAVSCKAHMHEILKLKSYIDSHHVPDVSIRRKAKDICDLLKDSERLSDERKRAKQYQTKYRSDSVPGAVTYESKHKGNSQSLGDIDDWEPSSRSIPFVIGESFINFVNTFTQNISGPPPTETHDNYDMEPIKIKDFIIRPAMSYEITTVDEELGHKPVSKTNYNEIESSITKDNLKSKEVIEPVEDKSERPIIDFFEPISDNVGNNNTDALFGTIDNDIDEEFGQLRSWNNSDAFTQAANNNNNYNNTLQSNIGNDFVPDFDYFSRSGNNIVTSNQIIFNNNNNQTVVPSSIHLAHSQPQPNIQSPSTQPSLSTNISKSEKKIGSTWNDIDALKIDLNNLCGRKHVYSKS